MKTGKPQGPTRPPTSVADAPTHTSAEVAQACGVTLRQLQWWDEKKAISPAIIDGKRMYTDAEQLQVRRIAEMRRAGIGLRHVQKYLAWKFDVVLKITKPTIINGVLVVPK